jgi:flagellar secretion chaperone FliS
MFAMPTASQPRTAAFAGAYRQVGLETGTADASPHRLVQMLFDGFQDSVAQARGALHQRRIEAKCKAIGHAVRILEEGLRAGLDLQAGGALAADLNALYAYVAMRLTHANLHNDEQALDECTRLIEPIRSAWAEIGPRVQASAR